MASAIYTLQHDDGTEVTAQEVYDAFVSGRVLLNKADWGELHEVKGMAWLNADNTSTDPTAIVYTSIFSALGDIEIGTYPTSGDK